MVSIDEVDTPRLRGERLRPHHRALMREMDSDPLTMRTLGGVRTPEH
jgi:hypothetical protein